VICPSCGYENIAGVDECEGCTQNLSSIDGIVIPRGRVRKVLMEDPISHLNPRDAVTVPITTSLEAAIKEMTKNKIGCLLVGEGQRLDGVITERDILFKVLGKIQDLARETVAVIMTPNPVTLNNDDSLAFALNKMSLAGFRHLPIRREGKPIGIISVRDILRHLSQLFPETAT